MMVVNRIPRNLKGIKDYGLWYKKSDTFELKVYTDIDQEGNIDDSKSTNGGTLF